jgi:hypothetical protein
VQKTINNKFGEISEAPAPTKQTKSDATLRECASHQAFGHNFGPFWRIELRLLQERSEKSKTP